MSCQTQQHHCQLGFSPAQPATPSSGKTKKAAKPNKSSSLSNSYRLPPGKVFPPHVNAEISIVLTQGTAAEEGRPLHLRMSRMN